MLNLCDFIQVYVFTTNQYLNHNLNYAAMSSDRKYRYLVYIPYDMQICISMEGDYKVISALWGKIKK